MIEAFRSSIGKKALMAVSGLILVGFVIGHLVGNLLVFLGPTVLNAYAKKLEDMGPVLWLVRGFLLVSLAIHLWTSIALSRENRRARPVGYGAYHPVESTYATRTMLISGMLALAYVVYHLLHFTFRVIQPDLAHLVDAAGHRDVYSMVVLSFRQPIISLLYLFGMAVLWSHLSHGIASAFQSLGLNNGKTIPVIGRLGSALAILLFLGYCTIPIAAMLGMLKPAVGRP